MTKYCHKINLTINYDWESTIHRVKKLFELSNNMPSEQYGNSKHYLLGNLGTVSKHDLSNQWNRVSGPLVSNSIPWLESMLETMIDLKPDNGAISCMVGPGSQHTDLPHMQTALNYVISNTDSHAITWVRYNDVYETYPSEVNTAWLLDTQKLHGIENNGERWTLSIHFDAEYNVVKEWFDNHPNLVFG